MKTLIIDNGSTLLEKLATLSPGEEIVVDYGNIPKDLSEYSLVILSGSSKFPIVGNEEVLADEIQLIRESNIPIVGICFGHELVAHTFGGEVINLGERLKGTAEVVVMEQHEIFSGKEKFTVYENHQYGLTALPPELKALAVVGQVVAVLQHATKPIYGFQFHPEHMTDQQFGDEVFLNLFKLLTS